MTSAGSELDILTRNLNHLCCKPRSMKHYGVENVTEILKSIGASLQRCICGMHVSAWKPLWLLFILAKGMARMMSKEGLKNMKHSSGLDVSFMSVPSSPFTHSRRHKSIIAQSLCPRTSNMTFLNEPTTLAGVIFGLVAVYVVRKVMTYVKLRRFPGPRFTGLSDLPHHIAMLSRNVQDWYADVGEKYGMG